MRHKTGRIDAPRVSVIIPAFQATRWIDRTVASVLHQEFEDFELIVVDDGSTDDLASTLASRMSQDGRIRLVRQDNRGLAGARNRGIAEARGALIAPIDADDLWHPRFLAETVAALDDAPDAPFAFARCFRMDEADRFIAFVDQGPPARYDLLGLVWQNSVGSGSAGLYRRSLMRAAGGYDESLGARGLPGAEDWKLILQMARTGDPVLVNRPLVGYRLHAESMSQENPRRQLDATLAVIEDIRAEMPEIADRHFADSRTGMAAWLLPTFARRMELRDVAIEGWHAYVLNPLWFRNPMLRRSHAERVRKIVARLSGRRETLRRIPLHEVAFEGDYPFAFLAAGADSDTEADLTAAASAR